MSLEKLAELANELKIGVDSTSSPYYLIKITLIYIYMKRKFNNQESN